ncbi:hypothetical protein [Desulfurivibrio sp. C05AmB]|uniref:hypothetical protein n=1 Tax=Desulfurivibrio sp. C05AmB TaxID=3374371 RepID=UPI00376ECE9E
MVKLVIIHNRFKDSAKFREPNRRYWGHVSEGKLKPPPPASNGMGHPYTLGLKDGYYILFRRKTLLGVDPIFILQPEHREEHGSISEKECFSRLKDIQKRWRRILEKTAANGAQLEDLNNFVKGVSFFGAATSDKYDVTLTPLCEEPNYLERQLEEEYVMTFLSGNGRDFRKLVVCQHCGKMFRSKRSTAKFCGRKCRDDYNNRRKIASGYLAAHQARGRVEKPLIYIR